MDGHLGTVVCSHTLSTDHVAMGATPNTPPPSLERVAPAVQKKYTEFGITLQSIIKRVNLFQKNMQQKEYPTVVLM